MASASPRRLKQVRTCLSVTVDAVPGAIYLPLLISGTMKKGKAVCRALTDITPLPPPPSSCSSYSGTVKKGKAARQALELLVRGGNAREQLIKRLRQR